MLKTEIKLNENRIIADGKYEPERIFRSVDNAFFRFGFRKEVLDDGSVCYLGNGNPRDYGAFGATITSLKNQEWFMPYVDKWLWCNSDRGKTEDDFYVEDVLEFYEKKGLLNNT